MYGGDSNTAIKTVLLMGVCFSPQAAGVTEGLGTRALECKKCQSWCSVAGTFLVQGPANVFCKEPDGRYPTFCESTTQLYHCRAKAALDMM